VSLQEAPSTPGFPSLTALLLLLLLLLLHAFLFLPPTAVSQPAIGCCCDVRPGQGGNHVCSPAMNKTVPCSCLNMT
jgi:hypothetical protein